MKRLIVAVALGVVVFRAHAHAAAAPTSKAEFCAKRSNPHYFRDLAFNIENQMHLQNHGGLFNGGVCWWHNLFQRAAFYLTVYRPELAKPNQKQAESIIHSIAAGKRVVEIPGYRNFGEFSLDWENQIQSKLESWQREDGFLKFAWIQGLSGSHETDPQKIVSTFEFILNHANNAGEIHWTMWQLKGITAHASINIGGNKTFNGSTPNFQAIHIDSNYPRETRTMSYAPPARSVESYFGKFVPYVARKSDLENFKKAGDQYCSSPRYEHEFFFEPLNNGLF